MTFKRYLAVFVSIAQIRSCILLFNIDLVYIQEVMFREIRQSREDPEVLAAQSQEQYDVDKVINSIVCLCLLAAFFILAIITYQFVNFFF